MQDSPRSPNEIELREQNQMQEVASLLPVFVDIQNPNFSVFEESIEDLAQKIEDLQDRFPQLLPKVHKLISEFQHNTPFLVFDDLFGKLNAQYFPNQPPYEQPETSQFLSNEVLPSMQLVKQYFESQSKDKEITSYHDLDDENIQYIEQKKAKLYHMKDMDYTDLKTLLNKIFNFFNGKIPRLFNTLLFFPSHLQMIYECFEEIFISPGPLPFEQVFYIALITSAATDNLYIYNLFGELFLTQGGNPDWIFGGFEQIPEKTKKYWEIIWSVLHHPSATYKYNKDLFTYLSEGEMGTQLSQTEISHAILISTFTDYLVTIAFGSGITTLEFPENTNVNQIYSSIFPDRSSKSKTNKSSLSEPPNMDDPCVQEHCFIMSQPNSNSKSLSNINHQQQQQSVGNINTNQFCQQQQEEEDKQQNSLCSFNSLDKIQGLEKSDSNILASTPTKQKLQQIYTEDIILMLQKTNSEQEELVKSKDYREISSEEDLDNLGFNQPQYSKFQQFSTKSLIFGKKQTRKLKLDIKETEYEWHKHLHEYLQEIEFSKLSKKLNQKLSNSKTMTSKNFGNHQNIDTSKFRQSIWSYVEIVLGYKRSGQSETEMTTFLNKTFRNFVRKLTLQPWDITKQDYKNIPYLFEPQDYMHVILLSAESKFYTKIVCQFCSLNKFRNLN